MTSRTATARTMSRVTVDLVMKGEPSTAVPVQAMYRFTNSGYSVLRLMCTSNRNPQKALRLPKIHSHFRQRTRPRHPLHPRSGRPANRLMAEGERRSEFQVCVLEVRSETRAARDSTAAQMTLIDVLEEPSTSYLHHGPLGWCCMGLEGYCASAWVPRSDPKNLLCL